MKLVPAALVVLLALPGALAGHGVNHSPPELLAPFYGEDGFCNDALFEGHLFLPSVPFRPACDLPLVLAEVAGDGYVVLIQRTGALTFEVRARHSVDTPTVNYFFGQQGPVHTPVAVAAVPLADPAGLGDGFGLAFLQPGAPPAVPGGVLVPLVFAQPAQTITESNGAWTVQLDIPPGSIGVAAPFAVAKVAGNATDPGPMVRGFYNPAKLAVAVDPLDAAPVAVLV